MYTISVLCLYSVNERLVKCKQFNYRVSNMLITVASTLKYYCSISKARLSYQRKIENFMVTKAYEILFTSCAQFCKVFVG